MANINSNHPIPYHTSLDTKLLDFGRRDHFTIGDACEGGIQIFGGSGSGKSSGSARALALSFLRAGFGGLVCISSETELREVWQPLAQETNRDNHLVILDEDASICFNIMDYAAATFASDGFDLNLVDMLLEISAMSGKGEGGGDNAFFENSARDMLSAAFAPVREYEGTLQLPKIYEFITSAPRSDKQLDDPKWQLESYFYKVFTNLAEGDKNGVQSCTRIIEDYGVYWYGEFPALGDRVRSSIVATVMNVLRPFLTGAFRQLWCTRTDIVPEIARQGLIIVLNIPTRKYGRLAEIAQRIFKRFFQMAMENSTEGDLTRPWFIFADECQFVMDGEGDAAHLSVARRSRTSSVYITQDAPTYFAKIGGMNAQNEADSLIGKFQTRIFHANTEIKTNEYAADICGKITKYQISDSQTMNVNTGTSGTVMDESGNTSGSGGKGNVQGRTLTTYQDYVFPPHSFARDLRTGKKVNNYLVDAIVIRNGVTFKATDAHYLKVTFSQR